MWLGWDPAVWALAAAACLVAGLIRGFAGFGFAMILVMAVAVVAPPADIVPIALVLNLLTGVRLLPHVHRDVDRRGTVLLIVGALPLIPLGALVLARVDEAVMRLAIGVVVLAATLAIAAGVGLRREPGPVLKLLTGAVAGLLTGAAGSPGPPVILMYLSSPLPVATLRATAVAMFLVTDAASLVVLATYGLVTTDLLLRCLVLAPVTEAGLLIGRAFYGRADPRHVRHAALALLGVLAVTAIARSLF